MPAPKPTLCSPRATTSAPPGSASSPGRGSRPLRPCSRGCTARVRAATSRVEFKERRTRSCWNVVIRDVPYRPLGRSPVTAMVRPSPPRARSGPTSCSPRRNCRATSTRSTRSRRCAPRLRISRPLVRLGQILADHACPPDVRVGAAGESIAPPARARGRGAASGAIHSPQSCEWRNCGLCSSPKSLSQ